mgnify:FL=1
MINFFILTICLLLIIWLFIEPNRLVVKRLKIKDEALKGLKIVFVSDFHIKFYEENRLKKIVDMINSENPDLVLSTGDFFSGYRNISTMSLDKIAYELGKIKTRYGFYTSLGNHDYHRDNDKVVQTLSNYGIATVSNNNIFVQAEDKGLYIAGVEDLKTGKPDVKKALKGTNGATILLTHSPDVFENVPDSVNLTLAGHLHGGQVRFPFVGAIFCPSKFGTKYASGYFEENNKKMYVTTGIGTSKLPIRFLCTPEIVVIDIE